MNYRVHYRLGKSHPGPPAERHERRFITFSDLDAALEWAANLALNNGDILGVETKKGVFLGRQDIVAALLGRRRTHPRQRSFERPPTRARRHERLPTGA